MKKSTLLLLAMLCCISVKAAIGDTFTEEYNGIVLEFRFTDNTGKHVELGNGTTYNAFYEGNINGNHSNPTGVIHIPQRVRVATNEDYITVVGIGDYAFNYCSGITEVVFDGYTIGQINYPSEITNIGTGAFNRCTSLSTIDFSRITSIGYQSFSNCTGLTSVTISSVTSIGKEAFIRCTNLTNVSFGLSNTVLKSIAQGAFYDTGITSISIPASVTSIGDGAFASGHLTSMSVAQGNQEYRIVDGCLLDTSNKLVQATISATSLPAVAASVGDNAFYKNTQITSVTISHDFGSIGGNAFFGCTNLTSVTSNKVTAPKIYQAFSGISSTATLTIPNGTTSDYTSNGWLSSHFGGGINETEAATLVADNKSITYGEALPTYTYRKTAGETVYGTPSLTSTATSSSNAGNYTITIAEGSVENKNVTYTNGTLTINKAPLTITAKNYTIKKGDPLPSFGVDYSGFVKNQTNSSLSTQPTVTCPVNSSETPGVYTLTPSGAAATNYSMNYVTGTLSILDDTFTANTIEGVPVEYKVLTTSTVAVGDGVSMEHVAIPTNTEGTVTIPTTITYNERELTVVELSFRAFHYCDKVTAFNLPNTITTIGAAAFSRCSGLTTFTFPSSVTSIGMQAFYGTSLTTVTVPATVTSIGFDAFGSKTIGSLSVASGNNVYMASGNAIIEKATNKLVQGCKNTVIPNTVTAIEDYAFVNTGIESLTIPTSVTTFGGINIFDNELTSLYIPHNLCNINLGVENSVLKPYIKPAQTYATFACAKDIDFSEATGLKAYVAKSYNDEILTLKAVTAAKAGEGLVLKVDEAGVQYSFNVPSTTPATIDNLLIGVTEAQVITETTGDYTNFILTNGSTGIGFYKTSGGTIAAGKAYLQLPTVSSTRDITMNFVDDDVTGISDMNCEKLDASKAAVYNLKGQRLQSTDNIRQSGIYIVNGKKVVVK